VLVGNRQKTEQFLRSALRRLELDFEGLRQDVADAVHTCARHAPELTTDFLWREMERSDSPRVRGTLVNLLEGMVQTPERRAALAQRAISEVLDPHLPESERARLRYGLVRMGEDAAQAVLERMPQAGGAERTELARLLDVLCTESDVADQTARRAVAALLELLKLADMPTRGNVLRASLLWDPRAGEELQGEIAAELLTLMGELNLPDSSDLIQNALERMGPPALVPAHDFMRRAYPSPAARRAALVVCSVVQSQPEQVTDQFVSNAIALGKQLLDRDNLQHGEFALALAATCGFTPAGAAHFHEIVRRLKDGLWKLPYCMDALEALGLLAGSPNADPDQQAELFDLFNTIVQVQGGLSMGVRRETDEGTVYEFGRDIDFDIRAVPAAVRGLERIYLSDQVTAELAAEIVKRLLILWEGVSKVRIVWGPAGVQALVNAMCRAACSSRADVRVKERLGFSLLRFLNKISVVRSIGEICSQPDADPAFHAMALEAAEQILHEWAQSDLHDDERRAALLEAAGRIAANAALEADAEQVRLLRERTVEALFSGLREGAQEVRASLLLMRDCPGLSAKRKQEIDERLGKVFGLVRPSAPR